MVCAVSEEKFSVGIDLCLLDGHSYRGGYRCGAPKAVDTNRLGKLFCFLKDLILYRGRQHIGIHFPSPPSALNFPRTATKLRRVEALPAMPSTADATPAPRPQEGLERPLRVLRAVRWICTFPCGCPRGV